MNHETLLKPRVLILHPALAPYRIDLFNALAESVHLKVLFFRANPVSQTYDQNKLRAMLRCEYGDLLSGMDLFGRQFRWGVGGAIREFQPQVVVAMEYAPSTMMTAWAKGVASAPFGLVIWTADNESMCINASKPRAMARALLLKLADGLVVYTPSTKAWYQRHGFPEEKIAVCSNINQMARFREQLTQALPLAQHRFQALNLTGRQVFLSVGRLAKIKGVDRILKAFAKIHAASPHTFLILVGDGPERANLEGLVRTLGLENGVHFSGQTQGAEWLAWYLLGQRFILASSFEPYGAVVHEALTSGLPVLCSQAAGAKDLITEGKNGVTFDPWSVDQLAQLMTLSLQSFSPWTHPPQTLPPPLMPLSFEEGVADFLRVLLHARREG